MKLDHVSKSYQGRTVLRDFPLFCPKCRQERPINAQNFQIELIDQPDAKTQC